MNFRLLFVIVLLSSCHVCCTAQNRLLILQRGDSIGNLKLEPEDDGYGTPEIDYNIPPAPLVVSGSFPLDLNFRKTANKAVNRFQFQHLELHYINQHDALSLDAHLILLENSNYEYTTSLDWITQSERIKNEIISNKPVQEAIYNWLMPVYQRAFAQMSVPEQNAFLQIFRNGLRYIDTLDLSGEKRVIDDEASRFIETRGEMNAFIYRRISKNELNANECRQWLNRVIADFESVMRKNPKPEDNYVVTDILSDDYVLAAPWTVDGGYSSEYYHLVVMRRTKTSYELLPAHFRNDYYTEDHLAMGSSEDSTQHTSFFVYDSLNWTFCNSQYNGYCYYHQFLGHQKNQTLLLARGWEKFQGPYYQDLIMASCALIDADSGTVLLDSLFIPTVVDGGYYTMNYSFPGFISNRIIHYNPDTQLYGMVDERGRTLLPAKYNSIERTDDPDEVIVNGKKKVSVFGGGKARKKK